MAVEILMPALDPSMENATVVEWMKSEGDPVTIGDPLVEIETDKAVIEVQAEVGGTLSKILAANGATVPVHSAIGLILPTGESLVKDPPGEGSRIPSKEVTKGIATRSAVQAAPETLVQEATSSVVRDRIFASPLAKRLAALEGLELSQIRGSGPSGRIVKLDIEKACAAASYRMAPKPQSQTEPLVDDFAFLPQHETISNSAMRKSIASRLAASSQMVPHYFLSLDCELDKLLALRQDLYAVDPSEPKITLNDFFIRASALALKKVPAANVAWTNAAILRFSQVDISVAVAIAGGLITPIVRNAESKGLGQISAETRALSFKARAGKLRPEEYKGGTFTISNLGMFGITSFTSIINPPQGAILSIGAGEPRPVVRDGQLCVATVMTVTLAVDHRCIDGVVAAEFLNVFKRLIEMPITMML